MFSRIVGARTVTRYDSTCVWLCHCRCQYGILLLVLLSLFWCLCFSFKELETQQQFYSCSLKHVYVICVVIVMFDLSLKTKSGWLYQAVHVKWWQMRRDLPDQVMFVYSLTVQLWACVTAASHFCSWLSGIEPCRSCSQSPSRLEVFCILRCLCSAQQQEAVIKGSVPFLSVLYADILEISSLSQTNVSWSKSLKSPFTTFMMFLVNTHRFPVSPRMYALHCYHMIHCLQVNTFS